jgi:hypothetical protein
MYDKNKRTPLDSVVDGKRGGIIITIIMAGLICWGGVQLYKFVDNTKHQVVRLLQNEN